MKKNIIKTPTDNDFLNCFFGYLSCETKDGIQVMIVGKKEGKYLCFVNDEVENKVHEFAEIDLVLYRVEFEKGDYVTQQCGDILICDGIENGKYCFKVAYEKEFGILCYPDEFYKWGRVTDGDRPSTPEEINILNAALQKDGKVWDKKRKEVVDVV